MVSLILFLILLVAVVYGLERNHRRERPRLPVGSADIEDRDEARVLCQVAHLE
ncbi:hypothetical protein [Amycolatopsis pigmentata]|uniref:Uncharacterized protein n=1 Tax=Amycolatopsis pigmentata TaxID=450801 RepID=A0ABW5G1V7_9PSEU